MKRNFAILGILMLSAWFAACSNSKTSAESNDSSKVVVGTENTAKSATQSTNKLPAVEGTKTVALANGATVTWIQDNEGEKLNPRSLFSDASDSLFESLNMPAGIPATVSTFLVQTNGDYILFDAGLGAFGGQLLNRLESLGVSPDSIKSIYLTHFHVDHIAGLISKDNSGNDAKAFKNAAIYAGKVEYDAWMNDIPKNDLQKMSWHSIRTAFIYSLSATTFLMEFSLWTLSGTLLAIPHSSFRTCSSLAT